MATRKTVGPKAEEPITLPPMKLKTVEVKLVGDTPLISHRWSDKAKKEMLDKQMKKARGPREAKDPVEQFRSSLYEIGPGVFGFPAIAFKSAAVDACSHVGDITKVIARGAFHIPTELVRIDGSEPMMREDMVRVGMGTSDIRYRGEFRSWSATLPIRFNANVISIEQLVNLFDIAGFAIGVGEWRPQKNGSFGMFHVARSGE